MTDKIILEWIKETCDAYCIPKPLAIVEALEAARAAADPIARDAVIEEWIEETCAAYCIPKPFAIIEAIRALKSALGVAKP